LSIFVSFVKFINFTLLKSGKSGLIEPSNKVLQGRQRKVSVDRLPSEPRSTSYPSTNEKNEPHTSTPQVRASIWPEVPSRFSHACHSKWFLLMYGSRRLSAGSPEVSIWRKHWAFWQIRVPTSRPTADKKASTIGEVEYMFGERGASLFMLRAM